MSEPDSTATSSPFTEPGDSISWDEVRVHRGPRYFRFMLAAVIVAAIVAVILTFSYPKQEGYDLGQVFGFLLLIAIVVGIALGSLIALLLDWIARRRSRLVAAERLTVHQQPDVVDGRSDTQSRPADAAASAGRDATASEANANEVHDNEDKGNPV